MADKLVERVVIGVDAYSWLTPAPGTKKGTQVNQADRGATIQVTTAEAERGEGLGALADPADVETIEADEARAEAAAAAQFTPASDDQIGEMTVEEVTAYVNQVPEDRQDDEIDRILDLEEQRDKPRAGVLALGEEPADEDE